MLDRVATLTATQDESLPIDTREVEAGKMIATISYVFCPIALLPFFKKDNAFSLYHAKQALALLVAAVAASIGLTAIVLVLSMVKLGIVGTVVSLAFTVVMIGFIVVGAMNAWNGRTRPLPLLGGVARRLFDRTTSAPVAS